MADENYRPLGLETDVDNKNFVGAMNPDSLLHVEFYWYTPLDRNKTEEATEKNKGIYSEVRGERQVYVRIMKPGDKTSIIETPCRPDHERRFVDKWRLFQIQNGLIDAGAGFPGWKVDDWDKLTDEQRHYLKFNRFYTVEQIAGAADSQLPGLGMGGLGIREEAKKAIQARATQAVRGELSAKQKEIDELKASMAAVQEQLKALAGQPEPRQKRKYTKRVKPEVIA